MYFTAEVFAYSFNAFDEDDTTPDYEDVLMTGICNVV